MTLTTLVTDPGRYRDKIVVLEGVVFAEKREASQLWLPLRSRPLDADYVPHRPISLVGPENGGYWVLLATAQPPANSHQWARVTVVGRMSDSPPVRPKSEGKGGPGLAALDVRGWSITNDHTETWQGTPGFSIPRCQEWCRALSASLLDLRESLWEGMNER